MSVLVVEILPTITNIFEQFSALGEARVSGALRQKIQLQDLPEDKILQAQLKQNARIQEFSRGPDPLSDELGQHRILRTSPLTEAPFVC